MEDHACYVIKYLLGTQDLGITFSSKHNQSLQSFVKFPIDTPKVHAMCNTNWGPQDASAPKPNQKPSQLELFKSCSISGYLTWFMGPLQCTSKWQTITACSLAEAEIYATDECIKLLQHFSFLSEGLNLKDSIMPDPTIVYNDNAACIQWSVNLMTKGLRHIQICENAVRESVQNGFAKVKHIEGKSNPSDLFTKEDKDPGHFVAIRDLLLQSKQRVKENFNGVLLGDNQSSHHSSIEGGVKLGNAT